MQKFCWCLCATRKPSAKGHGDEVYFLQIVDSKKAFEPRAKEGSSKPGAPHFPPPPPLGSFCKVPKDVEPPPSTASRRLRKSLSEHLTLKRIESSNGRETVTP